MSRGGRASSLGPEVRLGRAYSPVRYSAAFNSRSGPGGAVHPGEEKETMRDLNERLAGYLSQVRLLEEANNTLEAQIKEVLTERRAAGQRDWSGYEKTLSTLKGQVKEMAMDNACLLLRIDNAKLAIDDFKVKFETELAIRQTVEQDITRLRKLIDETHISRMQLESEIEALMEELMYLKKTHEEDVANVKGQIRDSNVDVQLEAAKSQDLSETIKNIRQQYEKTAQKNQEETEAWYQAKFETMAVEVSRNTDALQQGQSKLNDLRRQKQGLEIELQTMYHMNQSLEDTLNDSLERYSQDVNGHNMVIQQLEAELADVLAQVKKQGAEYQALLNIKSKLEEEIATYHSLLEGTGLPSNGIGNSGLPENRDSSGVGARDNINIKNIGPPEDVKVNDNGAFEGANTGGNDLGGDDESVEFSLEQALCAGPRSLIPDPTPNSENAKEEMITQKDLELNAANNAKNKQYNQEDGRVMEDQIIQKEIEEETVNSVGEIQVQEEEAASPVVDAQAEEAASPVVDAQAAEAASPVVDAQAAEAASPVVDAQAEEAASPVVDAQAEEAASPVVDAQAEEAASPVVDVQAAEAASPVVAAEAASPVVDAQAEEAVSPVVDAQAAEAASPVVDAQAAEAASPVVDAQAAEAASPVVDAQAEAAASPVVDAQAEEAASPVVDAQAEEAASPVVDAQAAEDVELNPNLENINPEKEKQEGEKPENPEVEPLQNVEE
ncbi:keratin, type I cytoskeletal 18 isoform X2 [Neoarius graeffei]|uniref:keratin, type I cytoskeletal 18 isoform X2 n=1 Tax=Neoarius graeffei TaxID=443677 RepID=UPI00298BF16A|nr:keratin, type I cytoskeletal 18 isoform X2 [Neoarius graeffei]